MYTIVKTFYFCYGHRLLKHPGKCAHYHGHNGRVEIVCGRDALNESGMVIDFDEISQKVKKWVDETMDHRMLLNELDPLIPFLKEHRQPFVTFPYEPTAENLSRYIFDECRRRDLPIQAVRVWETPTSSAVFSADPS